MKKSFGYRVVSEHGLISNILPGLQLIGKVFMSTISKRTYFVTVAWNMPFGVKMPSIINASNFPNIQVIEEGLLFKGVFVTIDGEDGWFLGPILR